MNKEEVQDILFNLYKHYTKRYKQIEDVFIETIRKEIED